MKRNKFIDNLRGFSVIMVFLFHLYLIWNNLFIFVYQQPSPLSWWGAFWLKFGNYGVDVFFTLSGFLIAQSLDHKRDFRAFFMKRFARIVPFYYAIVIANFLIFAIITSVNEEARGHEVAAWANDNLPYYFAFLASYRPFFGPDIAGHLWSLAVEEHFYLSFPLLVLISRGRIVEVSLGCFALLIAWRIQASFFAETLEYDILYHHSHFRMMGILMGVILYYRLDWFKGWKIASTYLLAAGIFYGFVYNSLSPNESIVTAEAEFSQLFTECFKHFFISTAVMILISNFKDMQIETNKLLWNERLGRASLSFYVMGYIANLIVSVAAAGAQLYNFWLYAGSVVVMTLLFSVPAYIFFEKWLFKKILNLKARAS